MNIDAFIAFIVSIDAFIVYKLQIATIYWEMNSNIAYFRLPYNVIIVLTCCILYWRCILTLRKSRTNRRAKLLTFAFAANLLSWVLTVMPHILFVDFVLSGEQLFLPFFFFLEELQNYKNSFWGVSSADFDKGGLIFNSKTSVKKSNFFNLIFFLLLVPKFLGTDFAETFPNKFFALEQLWQKSNFLAFLLAAQFSYLSFKNQT